MLNHILKAYSFSISLGVSLIWITISLVIFILKVLIFLYILFIDHMIISAIFFDFIEQLLQ